VFEDEHHGPALTETPSELAFRVHWVALGLIAAVGCGGNAPIIQGAVATLSLIGPALLVANRESYAGTHSALFWRALGWLLPMWFVLATLVVGHFFPPYHTVSQGENKAWELLPLPSVWVPVEGSIKVVGVETLLVAGVFATSLNAWIMCRSRLVFARAWAILSLAAGALATLGLLQYFGHATAILWIIPIGNPAFFSTFPHPAQWCAFALLWLGATMGLIAWLVRQRGSRWLAGEGWLFLGAALALGGSIAAVGEPAYRLLAALVAGLGCLSIAWQTREERRRAKRSGPGVALLGWALAGVVLFGLAAQVAIHAPLDDWIQYAGGVTLHERVLEDTRNMWQARPWFGWGPGSFRVIYSFFQGADQTGQYYAYARSDLWQSLAEHGLIGTVIWWVPVAWVLARLLWRRRLASFLIAPAAGLAAIGALTLVDFPLASPAVFFGFWLLLFSIARWSEVDQEDKSSAPTAVRRIKQLRAAGQTLAPVPAPTPPKAPAA
jgi:hypothetical protein